MLQIIPHHLKATFSASSILLSRNSVEMARDGSRAVKFLKLIKHVASMRSKTGYYLDVPLAKVFTSLNLIKSAVEQLSLRQEIMWQV